MQQEHLNTQSACGCPFYGVPGDKSKGASYPKDGSGISGGTSSAGKSTTHCPSGLPYKQRFSASEITEYVCKNKLGHHGKHPFDASVCSQLKVGYKHGATLAYLLLDRTPRTICLHCRHVLFAELLTLLAERRDEHRCKQGRAHSVVSARNIPFLLPLKSSKTSSGTRIFCSADCPALLRKRC